MMYLKAFIVGGLLCAVAQILVDKTKFTPARVLVGYVVTGIILSAAGIYDKLYEFAGAGASVPLTGFGHSLVKGVKKAIDENGIFGILSGGLTGTASGIAAVMIFSVIAAIIFKSHRKSS